MALFSAKNKSTQAILPGLTPCLSGQAVLDQGAKATIAGVKSLVSASAGLFQALYLETLYRVAAFCQALPAGKGQAPFTLFNQQIAQCLSTLQLRRGLLLPPNAGAEAIAEQEVQWTYAIFSASLFYQLVNKIQAFFITIYNKQGEMIKTWHPLMGSLHLPDCYFSIDYKSNVHITEHSLASMLAAKLIPEQAIDWLTQNASILPLWWEALTSPRSGNLIIDIVLKANQTKCHAYKDEVKSEHNDVVSNEIMDAQENNQSSQAPEEITIPALLNWLNKQPNRIVDNEPGLFRVKEGLFINNKLLLQFLESLTSSAQTTTQFIKNSEEFLYQEKGNFTFTFCPKAFDDRRTFKGIILQEDKLDTERKGIALTKDYIIDIQ